MSVHLIGARYFLHGVGSIIRPASGLDAEALGALPQGKMISVTAEAADWPKGRQFYWGMLAILVKGGVYAHKDAADLEIMVRAGRVSAMTIADGVIRYEPVSKAGWKLPEWREYLEAAVHIVLTDIVPTIPWRSTRAQIETYCGVRLADALNEETAQ